MYILWCRQVQCIYSIISIMHAHITMHLWKQGTLSANLALLYPFYVIIRKKKEFV